MNTSNFRNNAVLLLLVLSAPLQAVQHASAQEWRELFNGMDLSGWKANTDPAAFAVVDGAIRARATHLQHRSHLFYVGSESEPELFKNFELEVIARGEPGSNSGVFFHTDMETRDKVLHLKNGYEVQLNSSPKEKRKTGSLYAVVDLAESVVDDTKWFTVRVRVDGKRIQVWVDDRQTVDYTEPPEVNRPPERSGRLLREQGGAISLQAHDEGSTFHFNSVRIRRLP
ncbi:DUF1080 domain-containing protein [Blastopirellula marina]|uniref:DUF1080 domain-containing protein n=1 Tax=Blastopirellula marina TaxID=124 RepID=A0A2S8FPR2_9BACT|nr:DUF1080 domain-containing protein [Blastopirellula marina]PQO34000.1 DUF1080 domain-containing protein [Blastopirellula marina]PTL43786.1 DUF1080 domain-containing protein [Blastopirellula marina]